MSQPAGAREFWAWAEENGVNGALRIDDKWRVDDVAIAYAAQQTAAKDAALQAAERERDSLASDLQGANRMIRDYDERLKALKAENAALKAGKDGQQ